MNRKAFIVPLPENKDDDMLKCSKCGSENPSDSTFCAQCGTKLPTDKRIECASCHRYFTWDESYKSQDTPGSVLYNPPGHGSFRPRVFCPHCGALVAEWHITREKDFDEWIWFADNATCNAGSSLPPGPLLFGWGRSIPPQVLPYYDEKRLNIEEIKQLEAEKRNPVQSKSEQEQNWKQPFEEAFELFKKGNIKKTLELIEKAVIIGLPKREHAIALGVIGEHYLANEKDVDSALKYLLSSIETHFSGYWKAHLYLAFIYEAKGSTQKAKQEYRDAQRAEPNKSLDPDFEQKIRQIIYEWT
ncbi:MAG: hypothetical protein AYK18_12425 [Theionarchaea archaeon DG-70]|nr:MAG: hypothetical protein AYK18_12425 [Theionarchaea archaeon DG-70]